MLKALLRLFGRNDTQKLGYDSILDPTIPRYPPFMKGLPCIEIDLIVASQSEIIDRISDSIRGDNSLFTSYYLPAIKRFAAFCHLLPASQTHHHRGAGGLFRHSLEVALFSMQLADKRVIDSTGKTAIQKREIEPRWQLSVFLAGLNHDSGKPVTDYVISNESRTTICNPLSENLYDWAKSNNVSGYFIDWNDGRGKQHTALSGFVADRIMGTDAINFICEYDNKELFVWLMETLSNNPNPNNLMHDIVIKADQKSVERDLKSMGVAMAGYDIGVPVERHLIDIMKRLIKDQTWLINQPGAAIWNISGHVFLVWPRAGEDMVRLVNLDGIPAIPRTPDGILDMLVDRQLAFLQENKDNSSNQLWKIKPGLLSNKKAVLSAIRLKDETLISTLPIPSVEGEIISPERARAIPENNNFTLDASSTAPENVLEITKANESTKGDTISEQRKTAPTPAPEQKPINKEVAASLITSKTIVDFNGPIGETFKALAQDLDSGDKKWFYDVAMDDEGYIIFRWPNAFSGYGITGKSILDDLVNKGYLWVNPLSPLIKTVDHSFANDPAASKAVRLIPEFAVAFIALLNRSPQTTQAISDVNDGMAMSDINTGSVSVSSPSIAYATHKDTTSLQDKPTIDIDATHRVTVDQNLMLTSSVEKKSTARTISVEEIFSAILDSPKTINPDGSYLILKKDLMLACQGKSIKISHKRLKELADEYPEGISLLDKYATIRKL
jgi:conjugal transfer pilus assembly protein TraI